MSDSLDQPQSIVYPEPPAILRRRFSWRLFKYFGAGAILASLTIGSGEILFASRGGAVFGYSLLWCLVAAAAMKTVQVYSAARYITLTGSHPMAQWGQLPGPRNWLPILMGVLSLLCFPFWIGGLSIILGEIINWIFNLAVPETDRFTFLARLWGTLTIMGILILSSLHSYKILEKAQTLIVALLLLSIGGACLATQPDWLQALLGLIPSVPRYQDWIFQEYPKIAQNPPWTEIALYLGAVGGGTYDYIGYIGCLREKGWGALALPTVKGSNVSIPVPDKIHIDLDPENIKRARTWLKPAKIDISISFTAVLLFTLFFLLLGAAILHPNHLIPAGQQLLNHQADFLTQFHPFLLYLYQMGVVMAFWGTIYAAFEIYPRTARECVMPLNLSIAKVPEKRIKLIIQLYCAIGGLALLWSFDDPVAIIKPAAIVGGILTCGLWCFAMIWTDKKFLPAPLRMGKILTGLTFISGLAMTILGVKAIFDYLNG